MSIDFSKSFSIRPESPRVEPLRELALFVQEYPDEELTPHLFLLNEKYKYYRPICGDGNCFYRACLFYYFTETDLRDYGRLFPHAPVRDCRNLPFEFDDFEVEPVIKYIWREYLLPLADLAPSQRRRELAKKLNASLLLDAFLIAYLRSLNHAYLTNHQSQFSAYIEGDMGQEFAAVLNFGRESEGVELFAMAELLRMRITIMMVHRENFQEIVFREEEKQNIILFFRPGHYDILCSEQDFRKEDSFVSPSSQLSHSSNNWRPHSQPEFNIVKINSIQDLSRYGPKRNSSDGSNLRKPKSNVSNIDEFYTKATVPASSRKEATSSKKKGKNVSSSNLTQLQKKPESGKKEFKASEVPVPNVSPKRVYV
jgi:hypothetical protein